MIKPRFGGKLTRFASPPAGRQVVSHVTFIISLRLIRSFYCVRCQDWGWEGPRRPSHTQSDATTNICLLHQTTQRGPYQLFSTPRDFTGPGTWINRKQTPEPMRSGRLLVGVGIPECRTSRVSAKDKLDDFVRSWE